MKEIINKFQHLINDENTKIISFDIFDTLIMRPFNEPADLFKLLDPIYYRMMNGAIDTSFSKMRIYSEKIARLQYCSKVKQEITLDEIYVILVSEFGVDEYIANKLKKKEINFEKEFCYTKSIGHELFKMAQKTKKRIICISDMYMSKDDIERILLLNYYPIEDIDIYVSSEYMKTKYSGDLYDVIIKENDLLGHHLLHVGDNYQADIIKANEKKIKTLYLEKETKLVNFMITDWYYNTSKAMKVLLLCLYDRKTLKMKIISYLRRNK